MPPNTCLPFGFIDKASFAGSVSSDAKIQLFSCPNRGADVVLALTSTSISMWSAEVLHLSINCSLFVYYLLKKNRKTLSGRPTEDMLVFIGGSANNQVDRFRLVEAPASLPLKCDSQIHVRAQGWLFEYIETVDLEASPKDLIIVDNILHCKLTGTILQPISIKDNDHYSCDYAPVSALLPFIGHSDLYNRLSFTFAHNILAVASDDRTLGLYRLHSTFCDLVSLRSFDDSSVHFVRWSHDGNFLAMGFDNRVMVLNRFGSELFRIKLQTDSAGASAAWSSNDTFLCVASRDKGHQACVFCIPLVKSAEKFGVLYGSSEIHLVRNNMIFNHEADAWETVSAQRLFDSGHMLGKIRKVEAAFGKIAVAADRGVCIYQAESKSWVTLISPVASTELLCMHACWLQNDLLAVICFSHRTGFHELRIFNHKLSLRFCKKIDRTVKWIGFSAPHFLLLLLDDLKLQCYKAEIIDNSVSLDFIVNASLASVSFPVHVWKVGLFKAQENLYSILFLKGDALYSVNHDADCESETATAKIIEPRGVADFFFYSIQQDDWLAMELGNGDFKLCKWPLEVNQRPLIVNSGIVPSIKLLDVGLFAEFDSFWQFKNMCSIRIGKTHLLAPWLAKYYLDCEMLDSVDYIINSVDVRAKSSTIEWLLMASVGNPRLFQRLGSIFSLESKYMRDAIIRAARKMEPVYAQSLFDNIYSCADLFDQCCENSDLDNALLLIVYRIGCDSHPDVSSLLQILRKALETENFEMAGHILRFKMQIWPDASVYPEFSKCTEEFCLELKNSYRWISLCRLLKELHGHGWKMFAPKIGETGSETSWTAKICVIMEQLQQNPVTIVGFNGVNCMDLLDTVELLDDMNMGLDAGLWSLLSNLDNRHYETLKGVPKLGDAFEENGLGFFANKLRA